jgi:hypothetical protein
MDMLHPRLCGEISGQNSVSDVQQLLERVAACARKLWEIGQPAQFIQMFLLCKETFRDSEPDW